MSEIRSRPDRSFLARLFLSPDQARLRAGWRLLIQTILLFIFIGCVGIPLVILLLALDPSLLPSISQINPVTLLFSVVIEFFAITISVFLAVRFLDKRSLESLGLKLSLQIILDILMGIGIAFVQMGFIYAAMLGFGWLTFEGFAWQFDPIRVVILNVLVFFVVFIFTGWNEELLSRGYHLQTIARSLNLFWGVILSSAAFGLLHLRNPNATWVSAAGIFFAGVYLAYGYIRTKQLWLSMGLHLGWNFFEGVVFGFPVSGLDIYALTRIKVHGPELWTGGAFGPEAGLIVLPSLVLGGFLIYLYTRMRAN
jgi:CAAX protease family protein